MYGKWNDFLYISYIHNFLYNHKHVKSGIHIINYIIDINCHLSVCPNISLSPTLIAQATNAMILDTESWNTRRMKVLHTHVSISTPRLRVATRRRLTLPLSAADTCVCQAIDSPPRTMMSYRTSLCSRSPSCASWRHAVWRQDVCSSVASSRFLVSVTSQRQR